MNISDRTLLWGRGDEEHFPDEAIIKTVTDSEFEFEAPWSEEDLWDVEPDPPPPPPRWRRRVITAVGVLVAAAMLAGPVWNIFDRANPPLSDSGLELCGFDYCIVQDAVREAGFSVTMSRLANTYVDEEDARGFASELLAYLGEESVTVEVVDQLDGRIAGQYQGADRLILLERPVRAWIVLHEVAHVVASGHGEIFQESIIDLARYVEEASG